MTQAHREELKRAEKCSNAVVKIINEDHADMIRFSRETGCLVRDHILHIRAENERMRELLCGVLNVVDLSRNTEVRSEIEAFLEGR